MAAYNPYDDPSNPVAPVGFVKRYAATKGGTYATAPSEKSARYLAERLTLIEEADEPWKIETVFVQEEQC